MSRTLGMLSSALCLLLMAASAAGRDSIPPDDVIAVFDFESMGVDSASTQTITEEFRLALESAGITLADEGGVCDAIRQTAGEGAPCESPGCLSTVGARVGADRIVTGKVGKAGELWSVYVRVFDVAAGQFSLRERGSSESVRQLLDDEVPRLAALCVSGSSAEETVGGGGPDGEGQPSGIIIVPKDRDPWEAPRFVTRVADIELVPLPGGTFFMGSSPSESGSESDERPQHMVDVSSFLMSRHEITQAQFAQFDPDHRSRFHGWNRPVENVTWYDAGRFCNWLSIHEGFAPFYDEADLEDRRDVIGMNWNSQGYRLPTEAEWEYACRATCEEWRHSPYEGDPAPGGSIPGGSAWCQANSRGESHEVGQTAPTLCGLYDLVGNVREWVNDWHGEYTTLVAKDPRGPARGYGRVARGGAWSDERRECRCADRQDYNAGFANYGTVGFRIVRPWSPPRPRFPRPW